MTCLSNVILRIAFDSIIYSFFKIEFVPVLSCGLGVVGRRLKSAARQLRMLKPFPPKATKYQPPTCTTCWLKLADKAVLHSAISSQSCCFHRSAFKSSQLCLVSEEINRGKTSHESNPPIEFGSKSAHFQNEESPCTWTEFHPLDSYGPFHLFRCQSSFYTSSFKQLVRRWMYSRYYNFVLFH